MLKNLKSFFLFVLIVGCVEPYEFVVHDKEPSLVVEAYISDRSFNETLSYPSDGRYFTVKLMETGDVTNSRPVPVRGGVVTLHSSLGEVWNYTEEGKGVYKLPDPDFKAEAGIAYKLRILLPDENIFESGWEALPEAVVPPMGEIGFAETERPMYVMESGKWVLRTFQGITANIQVAENNVGETIYYRWTFSPMWIYRAPLTSVIDPGHVCWATDINYINTFGLQIDRSGGYLKDLFFLRTVRNERIFEKFSVLVTQHALTEPYYNFWKEMKDQNEGSSLIDTPPFNLKTNFSSPTGGKKVSGYFGVTSEQATRWYFDRKDLSYEVTNTLKADCLVYYGPGPPAPECTDCREYSFGTATTAKPSWWQQ